MSFYVGKNGKRYPVDYSLDKLEDRLPVSKFFRISRQFILNRDSIKEMVSYSKTRIKVTINPDLGLDTIVSKDRVSNFRKWLVEY